MANTNHRDLTGVALHEPKGAAAATDGQIYVADGSGGGAWTDAAASISVAVLRYKETGGVDGDAYATSWSATPINEEVTDVGSIITLSTPTITITAAGTYYFKAWAGVYVDNTTGTGRIRIINTASSTVIALGTNVVQEFRPQGENSVGKDHSISMASGIEVISASKTYQVQGIASTTNIKYGTDDLVSGGDEVYAYLEIWKIA